MRFLLVFSILCFVDTPRVLGQSDDWVIVPATTDNDQSWVDPTITMVTGGLADRGVSVWTPGRATTRFEQAGSAPSTEVTDSDIEEWVAWSRAAIRHLARGDYARALDDLKRAQVLSRKAADELNREKSRSQKVLDTCLYMVRALLETGNRSRANAQVQECVQLVPLGAPNEHMHPPNVIALYKDASRPDPEQTGSLVVESEPSSCDVRMNGVRFGKTPFEMTGLYRGTYAIQVECEASPHGRVHQVVVGSGKSRALVDVRFDRTVHTEPMLRLSYPERPEEGILVSDAQQVAKVLPAGAVVLVSIAGVDTMDLRVVSGTEKREGLARIATTPTGPSAADVSIAVDALMAGQCKDFTGPKPVTIDCKTARADTRASKPAPITEATPGWPPHRTPRGQFIAGVTLASVGTASLLTGYALLWPRHDAGNNWALATQLPLTDPGREGQIETFQERWNRVGSGIILSAAAGSALLVTSMPLVLPYRNKTPWWAWLSGGLGVGAAVASIAIGVTAPDAPAGVDCTGSQLIESDVDAIACTDRGERTDLAILLGTTSAPLLTMPLVYLLRRSDKRVALTPALHASRTGGSLGLRGAF